MNSTFNGRQGSQLLRDTNGEIKVRVLFFGAARDAAGHSEVDFVLKRAATAANALEEVLEKFPALRRFGRSLLFAVNQEYAGADCEV
ncbi:MAG: MoaD/ThiS family protein, partial [Acidobacteriota bacterium]|nr:MoaD/ThiS family protein [Acidobacteriota bacterium]